MKARAVLNVARMKQGNNLIVWIPKEFHKDAKQLKGKQVRIVIDDEI